HIGEFIEEPPAPVAFLALAENGHKIAGPAVVGLGGGAYARRVIGRVRLVSALKQRVAEAAPRGDMVAYGISLVAVGDDGPAVYGAHGIIYYKRRVRHLALVHGFCADLAALG